MIEKFPGGESDGSKEQVKSPEQLRFEELVKDAYGRALEGNYVAAETDADERAIHEKSMRGAYWESGDPEKMAMFELQNTKINLGGLAMVFTTLVGWDERQKEKGYVERSIDWVKDQKKGWENHKDRYIAQLSATLQELGLVMPQTAEEARALKGSIISSANLQKLAEKHKVKAR